MKKLTADNIDTLYEEAIKEVSYNPEFVVKPRGMEVKEVLNAVLELTNTQKCVVTASARKLNYAFATVEKLQYLSGNTSPERLKFYNSNFGSWQNKYGYFDGDYAMRTHYWLEHIYKLLKYDPDTRQAVLPIYGVQDRHESLDIPCTIMFHFTIRNQKLYLTVYMRSNDLLWGFPYDVSAFCFMQEFMSKCLKLEMGTYTHIAGSLHIYTEREDQLLRVIDSPKNEFVKPVIEDDIDFYDYQSKINLFWEIENQLRKDKDMLNKDLLRSLPISLFEYYLFLEKHVK